MPLIFTGRRLRRAAGRIDRESRGIDGEIEIDRCREHV